MAEEVEEQQEAAYQDWCKRQGKDPEDVSSMVEYEDEYEQEWSE